MDKTNPPTPDTVCLFRELRYRREQLADHLCKHTESTVQHGPFAGQLLIKNTSWGGGDIPSKLLGCYEAELHPALEQAISKNPELTINIGCAEGYYAIGLASRLPCSYHYAFDIDEMAQNVCKLAATINDVGKILTVAGECTPQKLITLLADTPCALLVLDCEGAEIELLLPEIIPLLKHTTLIVECHDFIVPTVTETLLKRLSPSHDCELLRESARDPGGYELLQHMSTFDRWLAVCEFRPCLMHWLVATPKK